MSGSITITFPATSTMLAAVLATLGAPAPSNASVPMAIAAAPAATTSETVTPAQAGSFMNQTGLAVLDAVGAAQIADSRNASAAYLAALRLMASKPDLSAGELLKVVGATTLAGNKAATTKRVQGVVGKVGAVLYRVERDKVVIADTTRQALARHFGFQTS